MKCKQFNNALIQAGNLKVHERIHPREKPFKCKNFVTRHCNDCARFSCNDRALLARCLRCIPTVFEQNLIGDNYIIVKLRAVKNGYPLTCIT